MSNVLNETAVSLINFLNQTSYDVEDFDEIGDDRFHETLFRDDECVYYSEKEEKKHNFFIRN